MENASIEVSQLGLMPISPYAPCGISARYEPEYELLQAEIDKPTSLYPKPINWDQVASLSLLILKEKSKDLLVASYLARGLFEQSGVSGLKTALTIYRDLIKEYWHPLFPELRRMQGRINAVTWMIERLNQAIAGYQPTPSEREAIIQCHALAEQISSLLAQNLGTEAPNLKEIISLLKGLSEHCHDQTQGNELPKEQVKKQEMQEEREEPQAVTARPTPSTPSSAPTSLATENDANNTLRISQSMIREVAAFLRDQNLADPLPYRILRASTWMRMRRLPESEIPETEVKEIRTGRVNRYRQFLEAKDYARLISEVEASFPMEPFWLDAHRFAAAALEASGASYAEARGAVLDELGHFIRRFPSMLDQKFSDNTPLADDQTRLWIENEVLQKFRGKPEGGVVATEGNVMDQLPWIQAAKEARALFMKDKFLEGVALFQEGQKHTFSERDRFLWRFHQAQYCLDAGYLEVAIPQLESLNQQVEHFFLEEWEPSLSVDVAQSLLKGYHTLREKAGKPEAVVDERMERLYTRLCRLDLMTALTLAKKPR